VAAGATGAATGVTTGGGGGVGAEGRFATLAGAGESFECCPPTKAKASPATARRPMAAPTTTPFFFALPLSVATSASTPAAVAADDGDCSAAMRMALDDERFGRLLPVMLRDR
jgi:hypothetical protein